MVRAGAGPKGKTAVTTKNYRNPAQKASAKKIPRLPWPLEGKGTQLVVARWRCRPAGHEHDVWMSYEVDVRVWDEEAGEVSFQVNRFVRHAGNSHRRLVGYVPVSGSLLIDLGADEPPRVLLEAFRCVLRRVRQQAQKDEILCRAAVEQVEPW